MRKGNKGSRGSDSSLYRMAPATRAGAGAGPSCSSSGRRGYPDFSTSVLLQTPVQLVALGVGPGCWVGAASAGWPGSARALGKPLGLGGCWLLLSHGLLIGLLSVGCWRLPIAQPWGGDQQQGVDGVVEREARLAWSGSL
jgi:hypothetical protein